MIDYIDKQQKAGLYYNKKTKTFETEPVNTNDSDSDDENGHASDDERYLRGVGITDGGI